jgi:hypothetical protein
VFRPEGDEEDRESWVSKVTFLLVFVVYVVGNFKMFSSFISPRRMVVV